jgi:hypothetical protein
MVTESWLPKHNGDILSLMSSLDAETYGIDVEKAIRYLLDQHIGVDTTPLPPYRTDELTPDRAMYWRILCESLATSNASGRNTVLLERFMPDTVEVCALVEAHTNNATIATEVRPPVPQHRVLLDMRCANRYVSSY